MHGRSVCVRSFDQPHVSTCRSTADCGERRLGIPVANIGPNIAEDSCRTSNNGMCEDQLYWSHYAPNDETFASGEQHKEFPYSGMCMPNTDLSDCGWRSPPRSVNLGVVSNNWCKTDGILSRIPALRESGKCFDLTRYWSPPQDTIDLIKAHNGGVIETCPLGSQKDECGEQPVYVEPAAPGGCHQTCDISILKEFLFNGSTSFDPLTTCSDGGPGSVRVRFRTPTQTVPETVPLSTGIAYTYSATNNFRPHYQQLLAGISKVGAALVRSTKYKIFTTSANDHWDNTSGVTSGNIFHQGISQDEFDLLESTPQYDYWDFACSFGSQCQACGPREPNSHREIEDELTKPTGPLFSDCDVADDAECCRKLATFPISKDNYHDLSATQCADICLFAGRVGEDGACMPQDPECANWNTFEDWPVNTDGSSKTTSVQSFCLCGPARTLILESQHVHRVHDW